MRTRPANGWSPSWGGIAAAWLGVGLLSATQTVFVMRSQGMHHAWTALFFTELLSWAPWAVATPLIVRAARRYPILGGASLRHALVHLAGCAAIAVASAAWVAALEELLNPWATSPRPPAFGSLWIDRIENQLLQTIFLYAAVVVVNHLIESRDRLMRQQAETARLNEQLSRARLRALQQQFEPHFLFNALNAVAGLVREGRNPAAVSAIAGLSDCLREVLRGSDAHFVALGREIQVVEQYLQIQKLRFGDRLQVTVDVPQDLLDFQVPSLVLQPIVDNAVKHGISRRARGGAIRIQAARSDGALALDVYNDGPPLTAEPPTLDGGIGLANLRARLHALYGDAFRLTIHDQGEGVRVSISMPVTMG